MHKLEIPGTIAEACYIKFPNLVMSKDGDEYIVTNENNGHVLKRGSELECNQFMRQYHTNYVD
jgi:hypothetical protein